MSVYTGKCMSVCSRASVRLGKTTDSCRRMSYQKNLQLVSPEWRLCMKMDVNAECRRKPAAEAFSNGPLCLSCPNWNNGIILKL